MRPYVLVFLPAFIAGCSCDDHPSVSAPTGPQGGTNPTRQQVTNENPPPEISGQPRQANLHRGRRRGAGSTADLRFAGHQSGRRPYLRRAGLVVLQSRPQ